MRRLLLATALALALAPAACAHDTSLSARVAGAERLVREAEERLAAADQLIKAGEELDKAGNLLAEAREYTQDSGMAYYADRENLEDRLSQADARLEVARDVRHRREIAAKVPEAKEEATALLVEFRAAADLLQDRVALDRKRANRAREALDQATRFLADSKELELDAGWVSFAATARKELAGRTVQVSLAEAVVAFHEGPVASNGEAKRHFDESKAAKGGERAAQLTQARDAWLACSKDAAALIAQAPALEREPVQLPGTKATAKSFAAACEAQAKSVDGLLKAPAKPAKPAKGSKPPPAKPPAKKKKK